MAIDPHDKDHNDLWLQLAQLRITVTTQEAMINILSVFLIDQGLDKQRLIESIETIAGNADREGKPPVAELMREWVTCLETL